MAKHQQKSVKKRTPSRPFYDNTRLQALFVVLLVLIVYGQTLRFGLVMDDNMVITDHKTVQQGFSGIPTLLTKDSFAGFDDNYERANQRKTYRPVSFVSFAVEKQLFNNNPAIAHGINVALYALTLVLLLALLRRLFVHDEAYQSKSKTQNPLRFLPVAVTLIFAVHPVHTAVVANIKSRDEIFALLFAVTALYFLFQYLRSEAVQDMALSLVAFALALLSKESAVLMLPVLVGMLYTFTDLDLKRLLRLSAPFVAVALVYVVVWFALVGRVEEGLYAYKLHNPFVGASFAERTATGFATIWMYTLKSIFPWTLSEGYTYNALPVVSWASGEAIAGFLLTLSLLGWAAIRILRRDVAALSIVAFFTTLLIASNLVVYAGSMLGERFLYTPSLFAILVLVWLLFDFSGASQDSGKHFRSLPVLAAVALLAGVYVARDFMRLPDWQSDYKLLQADHRSTPESMMTARNYASQLVLRAGRSQNDTERGILLDEADAALDRALRTDSTADPAVYDLQALSALQRREFKRAIMLEERALALDSATRLAIHRKPIFKRNLASVYVSRGAERINQDRLSEGIADLETALQLNPNSENAYINLGMIYGRQQEFQKALTAFQAAYKINPESQVAQQYIFHIQQAMAEEQAEKDAETSTPARR